MNKLILALALVCFGCGVSEVYPTTGHVVCYQAGVVIYDTTEVSLVEIWRSGGVFVEDQLQYYIIGSPYTYSKSDGFHYALQKNHIAHFVAGNILCRQLG